MKNPDNWQDSARAYEGRLYKEASDYEEERDRTMNESGGFFVGERVWVRQQGMPSMWIQDTIKKIKYDCDGDFYIAVFDSGSIGIGGDGLKHLGDDDHEAED